MNKVNLAIALSMLALTAHARPVVQTTPNVKFDPGKTVTTTWTLTDNEKKNTVNQTMMMSSLSATAIAPSGRMKKGEWQFLTSEHSACFYNTYNLPVVAKVMMVISAFGGSANVFESFNVAGGQGFCVKRYPQMLVKPLQHGNFPTKASTHAEMDGATSDNEGNGMINA